MNSWKNTINPSGCNVFLSGGDARRLGIRFIVIRRVSKSLMSSKFLANVYCRGRSYKGIVRIYRLVGWKIISVSDFGFKTVVLEMLEQNLYVGLTYVLKLLVLLVIWTVFTVMVAALIMEIMGNYIVLRYINPLYFIRRLLYILSIILLSHIISIL